MSGMEASEKNEFNVINKGSDYDTVRRSWSRIGLLRSLWFKDQSRHFELFWPRRMLA